MNFRSNGFPIKSIQPTGDESKRSRYTEEKASDNRDLYYITEV